MRKLFYLITMVFIVNTTVFAQDTLQTKKFYMGVYASPDLSYRTLLNNNNGINPFIVRYRDTTEIPMPAYTMGLDFLCKINKRVALSWGLQYSLKGYQTKPENYIFGTPITQAGFVSSPSQQPVSGYIKYSIGYADIPVRVNIYLIKGKVAPFITTGISTNVFLYSRSISHTTYADGHQTAGSSYSTLLYVYHRVNPQFQLGGGVDIAFKKSRLRFLPIARVSFLSDNKGSIKEYLWSLGVGISYLFGI